VGRVENNLSISDHDWQLKHLLAQKVSVFCHTHKREKSKRKVVPVKHHAIKTFRRAEV
jgi:hypothetical protein